MLVNGDFVIRDCDQEMFFELLKQEMNSPEAKKLFSAYRYALEHIETSLGEATLQFNSYCKKMGHPFLTKRFEKNEFLDLGIDVFDFLNGKLAYEVPDRKDI